MKSHISGRTASALLLAVALVTASCMGEEPMKRDWDFFCEAAEQVLADQDLTLEEQREQFAKIVFDHSEAYHSPYTVLFLDGCKVLGYWCYRTFSDPVRHQARFEWQCIALEALLSECPWE